jgi:hypothetical protein
MDLVFLYGPPGVGKLTVAKELARLTGYKLFDNHASIDLATRFFDFGIEPFWRLVDQIRSVVFEAAAREDVSVVSSFVYRTEDGLRQIERVSEIVERFWGRVCFVQLTCQQSVLEERVRSPQRAEMGKLTSVEGLAVYIKDDVLTKLVPGRESLVIDNTHVAPEEAARRIVEHYGLRVVEA